MYVYTYIHICIHVYVLRKLFYFFTLYKLPSCEMAVRVLAPFTAAAIAVKGAGQTRSWPVIAPLPTGSLLRATPA